MLVKRCSGIICILFALVLGKSCYAQQMRLPEQDRMYISVTNTDRRFPEPVYLTQVHHGKVQEPQHVYTFASPRQFYASPTGRYLLWWEDDTQDTAIHYVDLQGKEGKMPIPLAHRALRILSWAPDQTLCLLLCQNIATTSGIPNPALPVNLYDRDTYIVADIARGLLWALPKEADQSILWGYWSLDGRCLVYATALKKDVTTTQEQRIRATLNLSFHSIAVNALGNPVLGKAKSITPIEADVLLGSAVRPLMYAWEKEEAVWHQQFQPYSQGTSPEISISPDGKSALIFAHYLHGKTPIWASPDLLAAYFANNNHIATIYVDSTEGFSYSSFHWSSDNKWLYFLELYNGNGESEIWFNALTKRKIRTHADVGRAQGIVTQILP